MILEEREDGFYSILFEVILIVLVVFLSVLVFDSCNLFCYYVSGFDFFIVERY